MSFIVVRIARLRLAQSEGLLVGGRPSFVQTCSNLICGFGDRCRGGGHHRPEPRGRLCGGCHAAGAAHHATRPAAFLCIVSKSNTYGAQDVFRVPPIFSLVQGNWSVCCLARLMMSLQYTILEKIKKQAWLPFMGFVVLWPLAFGVFGLYRTSATLRCMLMNTESQEGTKIILFMTVHCWGSGSLLRGGAPILSPNCENSKPQLWLAAWEASYPNQGLLQSPKSQTLNPATLNRGILQSSCQRQLAHAVLAQGVCLTGPARLDACDGLTAIGILSFFSWEVLI